MAKTYYFATDKPGITTMVGTSDPDYIKRLDGFIKDEQKSEFIDVNNRIVITLKHSLSELNEAIDKEIIDKEIGDKEIIDKEINF